ncbi:tetratricopeptide repeat protein [Mesorhizobium sp. Root157]|uniref:tetratricopeptide repeat protein n=1 Tax=Mesorhizobium sp. Root157 TaxID=1736477 RepID=UPI0012E3B4B9|nr:tetratricopeptide repeat protein [Mesorhizobium sp. Root157]
MKRVIALGALLAANLLPLPLAHATGTPQDKGPQAAHSLPADKATLRERLFQHLAAAATEAQARALEDAIWNFWLDLAPNGEVRTFVDQAMDRREAYDFATAEDLLDRAIEQAPNYAEAWNQRAFIRFLRDNDEGAEADILRALELEPKHFGALSGLFHVLSRRGRTEAANAALIEAVKIHPWLKERTMLPPDPDAERPPIKGKEQDL